MTEPLPRFFTAREVAEILRLQYWTTLRLLAAGKIYGHRMGKKWRIPAGELDRLARVDNGSSYTDAE